jgi:hypothetical protein
VAESAAAADSLAAELRELASVCRVAAEKYPFGATDAEIQMSRILPAVESGGTLLHQVGDVTKARLIQLDRELKALPWTLENESRFDPNRTSVARGGYWRIVNLVDEILTVFPS